jgi:MFS family permease
MGGILADWAIKRSRAKHGRAIPEYRLLVTASGFIGFPAGVILIAWGVHSVLPIWVLCIAGALIGFNQFTVYTPLQTYLVDIFPTQSASIISLVNLGRYTIAAVAPLVVIPATAAMGAWWLTMWAILVFVVGIGVLAVGYWGTSWRESYEPWMPKMEVAEDEKKGDEEIVELTEETDKVDEEESVGSGSTTAGSVDGAVESRDVK